MYCCALSCKALGTKQYASMVHTLLKKAQGGEDGGAIEKISTEMLNGLSNLLEMYKSIFARTFFASGSINCFVVVDAGDNKNVYI